MLMKAIATLIETKTWCRHPKYFQSIANICTAGEGTGQVPPGQLVYHTAYRLCIWLILVFSVLWIHRIELFSTTTVAMEKPVCEMSLARFYQHWMTENNMQQQKNNNRCCQLCTVCKCIFICLWSRHWFTWIKTSHIVSHDFGQYQKG